MDREDQGFVALAKSMGIRLLGIAAGIFNGRHNRDEETDFLLGKLAQNNSIVCPHLTEPILQELLEIKTSKGFTLKDGLRRGIRNKDKTGITAGDEESYVLFQRVFDPLVKEIHEISAHHLPISSLKPDALGKTVFDKKCVISCRIRVLRSLKGFPFSWFCTIEERVSIQTIVTGVLEKLKGDLHGKYIPLNRLRDQNLNKLLQGHHIFLKQRCPLNRAWKEGRGIWHDQTNNLLILINEEEHIKIISQLSGDDLFRAFENLSRLLLEIESQLKGNGYEFMRNVNYGYLASRPQELGTCLRVSLNVKLPYIAKDSRLKSILKCLGLQRRKSGIRFPDAEKRRARIFEVSNAGRIGLREVCLVANHSSVKQSRWISFSKSSKA
ncbi:creatine kinase U-type, mitochondrial-like isoform X2 [Oculina patagonica]